MLRCREAAELMSDYVDGTLTRRRRRAVRLHLAMCEVCQRYARQMRATVALLRSLVRRDSDEQVRSAAASVWWAAATGPDANGGSGT